MISWLTTEARALLEAEFPDKLALPDTYAFTLVLVAWPPTQDWRVLNAVCRAASLSKGDVQDLASQALPIDLKRGMRHADAAIGQFELLACDALSFIIPDRVIEDPPPGYLAELYKSLAESSDFEVVEVTITLLPESPEASDFLQLFIGNAAADLATPRKVTRRKAWLMTLLAARIGGEVRIDS